MYILGIDGGGTKTTGVITNEEGKIYSQMTVGPTNLNGGDYPKVEGELRRLLLLLQEDQPGVFRELSSVFAGMAGAGRIEDQKKITNILQESLSKQLEIKVDHDALTALYSGTFGNPGIVNICGTGNIAFGINERNGRGRVGGWGFLLGDPGSGFSIGRMALKHVFAEYDGVGPKTLLTPYILDEVEVDSPEQLLPIIYDHAKSRMIIASLSRQVFAAAEKGDEIARSILSATSIEMGKSIIGVFHKLYQNPAKTIPVVLAGGIYKESKWFLPTIEKELDGLNVEIIIPKLPPVAGAVFAAFKEKEIRRSESFIENFLNGYEVML